MFRQILHNSGICMFGICFGCVSRRTKTVIVIWRLSRFIGGGRNQVPLRALFKARASTGEEPLMFRKIAGQFPHMKEYTYIVCNEETT